MEVVQDKYCIPDDLATGLAIGMYNRFGSVIRVGEGPNKGRIVKHLDIFESKATEQTQGLGGKVLQFVQCHKKEVGAISVGVAVIGVVSVWCYTKWKKREPKILIEFRVILRIYIDAIRNGNLDIDKIDDLMKILEDISKSKEYERINTQLTVEDFEVFVEHVYNYTIKLATDNNVKLPDDELNLDNDVIINLISCLRVQKRIFEAVD